MFTSPSDAECEKLITIQILKSKKIVDKQGEKCIRKLREYVDTYYQKDQRRIKSSQVDEQKKIVIAQKELNEFNAERKSIRGERKSRR